jgi:hypothetical protein
MSDDVRRVVRIGAQSRVVDPLVAAEIERLRAEVAQHEKWHLEEQERHGWEVERLKTRIEELEDEVQEGYDRINTPCGKVVDDLFKLVMPEGAADWEYPAQAFRCIKERIEELEGRTIQEKIDDICEGISDTHVITTDQIDAAWKVASDDAEKDHQTEGALVALGICGIVECEECGGSGQGGGDPAALVESCWPCETCHGHRWVKN